MSEYTEDVDDLLGDDEGGDMDDIGGEADEEPLYDVDSDRAEEDQQREQRLHDLDLNGESEFIAVVATNATDSQRCTQTKTNGKLNFFFSVFWIQIQGFKTTSKDLK